MSVNSKIRFTLASTQTDKGVSEYIQIPSGFITLKEFFIWKIDEEKHKRDEQDRKMNKGYLSDYEIEDQIKTGKISIHRKNEPVDKDKALKKILSDFKMRHLLVYANNKQVTTLTEKIEINNELEIKIIRLIPLTGG